MKREWDQKQCYILTRALVHHPTLDDTFAMFWYDDETELWRVCWIRKDGRLAYGGKITNYDPEYFASREWEILDNPTPLPPLPCAGCDGPVYFDYLCQECRHE